VLAVARPDTIARYDPNRIVNGSSMRPVEEAHRTVGVARVAIRYRTARTGREGFRLIRTG
jgi:hypothetical protein